MTPSLVNHINSIALKDTRHMLGTVIAYQLTMNIWIVMKQINIAIKLQRCAGISWNSLLKLNICRSKISGFSIRLTTHKAIDFLLPISFLSHSFYGWIMLISSEDFNLCVKIYFKISVFAGSGTWTWW